MKREERYLHKTPRLHGLAGFTSYKPDAPLAAPESVIINSASGKFGLKSFILSFLIAFALLFASAASADAYYLNAVDPQNNTWVTKSPYVFQWNNNTSSGVYWGGNSAYWQNSYITIYNYTWGYRNNGSAISNLGLLGTGSYSRTLRESPLGKSYWRVRGYYRTKNAAGKYVYSYTNYTNWSYFGVDLYAPSVNLTSPANNYNAGNKSSVSFLFSADDSGSGISTSIDDSYLVIRQGSTNGAIVKTYAISTGNNTKTHTFTASGTFYWRVVAKDRAAPASFSSGGPRTTYSSWRKLTIDIDRPSRPVLISPIDNIWLTNRNVTFRWTASSDVHAGLKGYYLKINRPDKSAYPGYGGTYGRSLGKVVSRTINGMPETPAGNYEWWVYAEDNSNNKSLVSSGDGRFRIDATAPKINVSSPKAAPQWYNEYTASSINFKAIFSDGCSGLKETYLKLYRPGLVHVANFNWAKTDYAAYVSSAACNEERDCKSVEGNVNGIWRAVFNVKDQSGRTTTANLNFQVDITRPTVGSIISVDGTSITSNPIDIALPVAKVARPVIRWTAAATENSGESGVANYYVKIWNSAGRLVVNTTLAKTAVSYTPPALTSGLYYFEVSVADGARNGAVRNVDGTSGNNQTFYTTQDTIYSNKRRFIVHYRSPYVLGYFPPLFKCGNGSAEWVVSANPAFGGEMNDTYGISKYDIRVYRKTGTSYSAALGTYSSYLPLDEHPTDKNDFVTRNNVRYKIIPGKSIVTLTDGLYGFEIQAWNTATNITKRISTIAPTNSNILKYDFKVDLTPPIKGTVTQPVNDTWIVKPTHANTKRPTFIFGASNDNQVGTNDDASFSGVKEYMIRLWWDPTFPDVTSYAEAPFLGQPYKDYYIGTATTWTIPDDLKNGRYYWDVWVKDNANNWRWYYNATVGNYTTTSVYGNTARPTDSTYNYKFRVDTTEPITSTLVSNIGDVWITVFNPSFVWKASDDAVPGSGRDYYELWLWGSAGGSPIVVRKIPCVTGSPAPGDAAAGSDVTLPYGGGTHVSGAWPSAAGGYLPNGRYYWDIKFVDIAGNYKWYKSGRVNQDTVYNLGESFRVDKIPPTVGGITYPKNNEWIDQKGTRSIDPNTGDAIYTPNKKPSFKFNAAKDNESGLYKYIVILKDARSPKVIIGDQALTAADTPSLFSLPFGSEFTFNPPWGTGTWPVELRDGKYFWEVMVIDNTKVNTTYYKSVNGTDANYETFRLDTIPPTLAVNKSEPIRAITPATTGNVGGYGVGELLLPAYGYITTISVNLVNFQFSKAVDDINTGFNGYKLGNTSQSYSSEGPSGVYRYNFVIASTRDKLKEFANVDIWTSGYTIDTTANILNFRTSIPDTIDAELNALTVGSLYWSVHVIDNAGNEAQYVDRKMRIRHLPPGGGNLEAPPHGFTTTNRRPTFKWTK